MIYASKLAREFHCGYGLAAAPAAERAASSGLLERDREPRAAAPDAMVVADPEGEIVLLDAQAGKPFGYPPMLAVAA